MRKGPVPPPGGAQTPWADGACREQVPRGPGTGPLLWETLPGVGVGLSLGRGLAECGGGAGLEESARVEE